MDRFRLKPTGAAEEVTRLRRPGAGCARLRQDRWIAGGAVPQHARPPDAYGEFGTKNAIRVGRQELAFGEQRLLGHLVWANTARSFDGARATIKGTLGQIDGFAASVVTIDPSESRQERQRERDLRRVRVVTIIVPKQALEPYVFWRQARGVTAELGGTAPLHQATTGVRMAGKLPSAFDYSGEIALQTGSVGADDVKAWASHGLVGKAFNGAPSHPRVFGEYNYASGDADRTDGTRGTFDQLYPTGHDKLGLWDQVGWKNIHNLRAGVEVKPTSKVLITALSLPGGSRTRPMASTAPAAQQYV